MHEYVATVPVDPLVGLTIPLVGCDRFGHALATHVGAAPLQLPLVWHVRVMLPFRV